MSWVPQKKKKEKKMASYDESDEKKKCRIMMKICNKSMQNLISYVCTRVYISPNNII